MLRRPCATSWREFGDLRPLYMRGPEFEQAWLCPAVVGVHSSALPMHGLERVCLRRAPLPHLRAVVAVVLAPKSAARRQAPEGQGLMAVWIGRPGLTFRPKIRARRIAWFRGCQSRARCESVCVARPLTLASSDRPPVSRSSGSVGPSLPGRLRHGYTCLLREGRGRSVALPLHSTRHLHCKRACLLRNPGIRGVGAECTEVP